MDTASPSEQSAQTIFENEGMAKAAVMGVYSYLGDTYVYGQKMSVNWQGNSDTDMSNGFMENPSSDKMEIAGLRIFGRIGTTRQLSGEISLN